MQQVPWYDVAGLIGVALILTAYALLQFGRLGSESPTYSGLNALGALLILLSLLFAFNLPAFVIQVAWLAISLFGLWRWRRRRQRAAEA